MTIKVRVTHDDPKIRTRVKVTTHHGDGKTHTDVLKPGESRDFQIHPFKWITVQEYDVGEADDGSGGGESEPAGAVAA